MAIMAPEEMCRSTPLHCDRSDDGDYSNSWIQQAPSSAAFSTSPNLQAVNSQIQLNYQIGVQPQDIQADTTTYTGNSWSNVINAVAMADTPADGHALLDWCASGDSDRALHDRQIAESIAIIGSILPNETSATMHGPAQQIEANYYDASGMASGMTLARHDSNTGDKKKRHNTKKKTTTKSADFHVLTPNAIAKAGGVRSRYSPQNHMGRKGPLPRNAKDAALRIRQRGACFCCRARKVKCDMKRPCEHCSKLAVQMPQLVCWQFPDFLPALLPGFVRDHFEPDEMAKFMSDNVGQFLIEMPCEVALSSGWHFETTLKVSAMFYTTTTGEGLEHWLKETKNDVASLESQTAVQIGLDTSSKSQRDALKRNIRDYVQSLNGEPLPTEVISQEPGLTRMSPKILDIAQRYANSTEKADNAMVRRALSIYTMHYVMTRHLCLTRESIVALEPTKMVPQNSSWVTSRVLGRQIKSALNDLMLGEVKRLLDDLAQVLKRKSQSDWAPCVASFLLMCLFMESVETCVDWFVIAENETARRDKNGPPLLPYKRDSALKVCDEIEQMPFRQCALQIHRTFQSHSQDKGFNPIVKREQMNELDKAAGEMVMALWSLLDDRSEWEELDLTVEPILGRKMVEEKHPFPREVAHDYAGRLVATFLLSFEKIDYIS